MELTYRGVSSCNSSEMIEKRSSLRFYRVDTVRRIIDALSKLSGRFSECRAVRGATGPQAEAGSPSCSRACCVSSSLETVSKSPGLLQMARVIPQ